MREIWKNFISISLKAYKKFIKKPGEVRKGILPRGGMRGSMNQFRILLFFELKKIFGRRLVLCTLAVTILACVCPVLMPLLGSYVVNGEKVDTNYHMMQVDRAYQEKLDGRLIDGALIKETLEAYHKIPENASLYIATEEYQKYARPYSAIFNFIRANSHMNYTQALEWQGDETNLYAYRLKVLEAAYDANRLSEEEKFFWRQHENRLEWPIRFEITDGWYALLTALSTLCFILPLCLAVCLSNVFPEEHTRRTDQLILCAKKGRDTAYLAKVSAGIIFSILCALTVTLILFLFSLAVYGTDGFHAAFQLLYTKYPLALTAGQAVLIMYGVLILASILFAALILFLSEAFHSGMAALSVISAYLILSMFIAIPDDLRILGQIWDWLPGAFVTPWNIFDLRLLSVFGARFTAWQAVPALYLLAAAGLALAGAPIYRRYQVSGR